MESDHSLWRTIVNLPVTCFPPKVFIGNCIEFRLKPEQRLPRARMAIFDNSGSPVGDSPWRLKSYIEILHHELELLLRSSLDFVFIYLLDFALIYQLMEAVATTQSTHKAANDHPTPGAAASKRAREMRKTFLGLPAQAQARADKG